MSKKQAKKVTTKKATATKAEPEVQVATPAPAEPQVFTADGEPLPAGTLEAINQVVEQVLPPPAPAPFVVPILPPPPAPVASVDLNSLDATGGRGYVSKTDPNSKYHLRDRSLIDKPVSRVHAICDANPNHPRKDILAACVQAGINKNTAATQYSIWKGRQNLVATPAAPAPVAGEVVYDASTDEE